MRVRKAVFPAAGWGTRFLPATKAQPKEMLPLVDKPVIQYAVEEAVAAGIEQVIIVTSSQKRAIEDHFDHSFELENLLEARGDIEMLRRVRQIEIHAETQTLTGPSSRPILRGRFSQSGNNLNFVAQLEPVNYVATPSIETEQSCADLVAQSIEGETILLNPTESLTETLVFSQTRGTATLDPTTGNLFLDLKNLPQPETTPYEIKVTFWPNRTDSVGYFQPQADQQAQVNIQFNEKSRAPIEYYYQLGLAYAYLDNPQCDKAVPWLLRSLEIDSSGYNPAWAGLRICPSSNSPPTPIPTWTPEPTDQPQ